MASLTLRGLSKRFDAATAPALHPLSLDVPDGDFLVFLGPSGCGKTTVLRLVAGLEEPSGGEILLDGHSITDLPPAARNVAMVFQNYALYPHLTVRDNIAFPLRMRRRGAAEIAVAVRQVADRLGVGDLLDRRPAQLSGGQRQRVALGRALVREPAVFLFDEPLSNLDAKLRVEMRAELLELHRSLRATMVYVTHDQVEAMTMGSRIAVLDRGVLRQVATPREIYERPADRFVARFVGSPGMNVLPLAAFPVPGLPVRTVDVGVRPEALRIVPEDAGVANANVEVVEPLGGETLVYLRLSDHRLVARRPGLDAPVPGDVVGLAPAGGVMAFDAAGRRLDR